MSKKRHILPLDHLPSRCPLLSSVVAYMALDMYHATGWLWGVVGALYFMIWLGWIAHLIEQETKPMPGYGEQRK